MILDCDFGYQALYTTGSLPAHVELSTNCPYNELRNSLISETFSSEATRENSTRNLMKSDSFRLRNERTLCKIEYRLKKHLVILLIRKYTGRFFFIIGPRTEPL